MKLQLAISEENPNTKIVDGNSVINKAEGENLLFFARLYSNKTEMGKVCSLIKSIPETTNSQIYLNKLTAEYDEVIAHMFIMDLFNNESFFKKQADIAAVNDSICDNIQTIALMAWSMLADYDEYYKYIDKPLNTEEATKAFLTFSVYFGDTATANFFGHKRFFKFIESPEGVNKLFSVCLVDSAISILTLELKSLLDKNIKIKKCQNCKEYFIPLSRSDEIYCNNAFKGNKTCKQLGYELKINSDNALKEYRKKYKTKNAFKNRNITNRPQIVAEFEEWHHQAKSKLKELTDGRLSEIEFIKWLNREGICDGKHNKEE